MSISQSNDNYVLIEFSNKCDLNGILYQKGFVQRMFIDSDCVKPKYLIQEEGYNDGEGNFIKTFQRERKVYSIEFLAYEFNLDALYTIPLHDYVRLYFKNGESDLINETAIEHDFVTAGIAKVKMTFITKYVVKTGCCNNLGTIACSTPNHTVVINVITDSDVKFTDPLNNSVLFHDRYIVTSNSGAVSDIYEAFAPQGNQAPSLFWSKENSVKGDVVKNNSDGFNYYYDAVKFNKFPTISSIVNVGGVASFKAKGFVIPNTFVKLYYKKHTDPNYIEWGTIVTASVYRTAGITVTGLVLGTTYDVKILCYNHNCNYGYSAVSSYITPPP